MSSNFLHLQPAFTLDPVEETEALGGDPLQALAMQVLLSSQRKMLAVDNADTCFGDTLGRFCAIATRIGFVQLAQHSFERSPSKYDPAGTPAVPETLTVYKHPCSHAVLTVESYNASGRVNSAKMYFVVNPQEPFGANAIEAVNRHAFGGAWESLADPDWRRSYKDKLPADCVFVGNTDVRECLSSQHQAVLGLSPVIRPNGSRFEITDSLLCSQDYSTLESLKWPDRLMALDFLCKTRLRSLNLNSSDFGVSED